MAILLLDSSICVNCLMKVLNLPQSTISRHLSLLRRGGVVRVTRDNTYCYYTLDTEGPLGKLKEGLINSYFESLKNIEPFKSDLKRLRKMHDECSADCKVCVE